MVNQTKASEIEKKVLQLLRSHEKLEKYDLGLHIVKNWGVDIEPQIDKYTGLAIEVENTETRWPEDAPYPPSWRKGFSVPSRKQKFYMSHPLSIYLKVNQNLSRAAVVPMAFVCGYKPEYNGNREEANFRDNNFYFITDPEHPAICYCSIEDMPKVVASQLEILCKLKNINHKYTGGRPIFDKALDKAQENK